MDIHSSSLDAPAAALADVQALYDAGRNLEAHAAAQVLGPYREWRGTRARVLAGRLVRRLGAPRLATALHFRAFRDDPEDLEARYFYASSCIARRTPLAMWEFLQRSPLEERPGDADVAHLLALEAQALAAFRDFERAHALMDRAEALHPDDIWLQVSRSYLLERADRLPEALEASQRALEQRPHYQPAVLQHAGLLAETDRLDQAIALLTDTAAQIESMDVLQLLAYLRSEAGDHGGVLEAMEALIAHAPLIEPAVREWAHGRQASAAYLAGDVAAAVEHAKAAKGPFMERMAELDAGAPQLQRHELAMGFVRQHHVTCGPATLASIARYWQQPVDQAELAEEICYGGTYDHGERGWAERSGYVAREFTVTIAAARQLLDRGVPFTLTTLEPTSGHLQAVYGYDERLQTLLVRDPSSRHFVEYGGQELLDHYGSSGPRGMAMVTRAQAPRLEGLELPDVELYDQLHALKCALLEHDREGARTALQALRALDPDHRITIEGILELARYDGDRAEQLRCHDRMLALFPDDNRIAYAKLGVVRDLADHGAVLALLKEWAEGPERGHPALLSAYAEEIRHDGRLQRETHHYLQRALRAQPLDSLFHHQLADVLWGEGELPRALALYRFAACLNEVNEHFASEYFRAARLLKQTDVAFAFLRRRADTLGEKSGAAPITYFDACEDLSREDEGFAALERSISARADDGELLLFAAEKYARYGRFERCDALLAQAEGCSHRVQWLIARARIEPLRDRPADTEPLWREVVEKRPLDLEGHAQLARRLLEAHGPDAAAAHLRAAAERFPHHFGLARMLAQRLVDTHHPEAEGALRRMVETAPTDAWARRELAVFLIDEGKHDAARDELERARELDDRAPALHAITGMHARIQGDLPAARKALRRAIELDVDNTYAIAQLLLACETLDDKRAALWQVEAELVRQTTNGDGLLEFRAYARTHLGASEAMEVLRAAHEARKDLPQAWYALSAELIAQDELEPARALTAEALERFASSESLWLQLAEVCELLGDREAQEQALLRAMEVAPSSTDAGRSLGLEYRDRGTPERGVPILRRMVAKRPMHALNHGVLGELLWQSGEREEALACVKRAVELDPDYDWAWGAVGRFARELDQEDPSRELAKRHTEQRPGSVAAWLLLARVCADDDSPEECLSAIEHAIALSPRAVEAHDLKAEVLAHHERYGEALEAAQPPWGGPRPHNLEGRRAWVLARRGDIEDAIAAMRAVLSDHPDYGWGWRRLMDWCEDARDVKGSVEAGRALLQLEPHDATAHGYLAAALLADGDRDEAKVLMLRASELDPSYNYASVHVFDMGLEDGELDACAAAMERLDRHGDSVPEEVHARGVMLETARGDGEAAEVRFRALCAAPFGNADIQQQALDAMVGAGLTRTMKRIFHDVLTDSDAAPESGGAWVLHHLGKWRFRRALWGALRLRLGPAGLALVSNLITEAGRNVWVGSLQSWLWAFRSKLRRDTGLWGAVGYALLRADLNSCVRWMRDWRARPDAAAWMINMPALAHELMGRFDRALPLRVHGLALPPDHSEASHCIWAAFGHALERDVDAARAALERAKPLALKDELEAIRRMTEELVAFWIDPDRDPLETHGNIHHHRRVAMQEVDDPRALQHAATAAGRRALARLPFWKRIGFWMRG